MTGLGGYMRDTTGARLDSIAVGHRPLRKFIPATALFASLGSPSLTTAGRMGAWLLDPATAEAVGTILSDLPAHWHGKAESA